MLKRLLDACHCALNLKLSLENHGSKDHSQTSQLFHPLNWWSQAGSNRRPPACKAGALPAELWPLFACLFFVMRRCACRLFGHILVYAPSRSPAHALPDKKHPAQKPLLCLSFARFAVQNVACYVQDRVSQLLGTFHSMKSVSTHPRQIALFKLMFKQNEFCVDRGVD